MALVARIGRTVAAFSSRLKAKAGISSSQPMILTRNYCVLKNHIRNPNIKHPNLVAKSEVEAMRCRRGRRWYRNPWKLGGLVGFGIIVYYQNLETVPYSKRRRFVIVSSSFEKKMAKFIESYVMSELYKGKIVGSDHPDRIRVERVGRRILDGLRNGFKRLGDDEDRDRLLALLDEYNWEFIVVDDPTINNAMCSFAGKIIIFTGMLQHLDNDFDIAVVISHEVGHAVARHTAECMSSIKFWLLSVLFPSYESEDTSGHFLWDPINRRQELEADYIGFLISASAGYDPWKMLEACKKSFLVVDMMDEGRKIEGCSSHPSGEARLEHVSQAKVMEQDTRGQGRQRFTAHLIFS